MNYSEKINWSLDQKIYHFFEVLDVFYHRMHGDVYISFSGGLDSTVLVHMCDLWCEIAGYPKIKLVFNNTTNEYPQILKFVKSYGDRVEWLRPKMTFAQVLKRYGYPLISKEQSMAISRYRNTKREDQKIYRLTGIKRDGTKGKVGVIAKKWADFALKSDIPVTNRCCDILKKDPVHRFEKRTGLKPIIGVRAEETNTRRIQYIKNGGCNVFTAGKEKSAPLSIFTKRDMDLIIEKFDIRLCDLYYDMEYDGVVVEAFKQTGCMWCGFGAQLEDKNNTRFHKNKILAPKQYESFMTKLGYRKALAEIGIILD